MNKTVTLEEISNFSDVEIDRFIADFLANGNHQYAPDSSIVQNIMNFSRVWSNPLSSDVFPGMISN